MPPQDLLGRPLRNLRISVTDRCNLRCEYCMPEAEYVWLPKDAILTFEEIATLVSAFASLGVDKVRLTGGEPLLRRDLPGLVAKLAANRALRDLALTTNGVLLADQARALKEAGLHRVTVSLDTLRAERFRLLTRRDELANVLRGLEAVATAGFSHTKLDAVIMRGVNADELVDLIEFARRLDAEVRFIEYMDVGGATRWSLEQVVTRTEMLERLAAHYGTITPLAPDGAAPAERFALPDGTTFGIIASTTSPFCRRCDRSRLTADGLWYSCLYASRGLDLRTPLRSGASAAELSEQMRARWSARDDRGAEERLALRERAALVSSDGLKADPHLEMHTRGG